MRITPAEIAALALSIKVAVLSLVFYVSVWITSGLAPCKTDISRKSFPEYTRHVSVGVAAYRKWVFTPYSTG